MIGGTIARNVHRLVLILAIPFLMAAVARTPNKQSPEMQNLVKPSTPMVISTATASQLADAMGIPAGDIVSASLGTSDPAGAGVGDSTLGGFPSEGSTFAILATGLATTADTPNSSESTSDVLGGLNNGQSCFAGAVGCDPTTGNDLVQLTLVLNAPVGATCLTFDVAFYSEEFPEFVGDVFNDAFTAEIGGTDLQIINNQVVAPMNFAFDPQGNLLSVNTVFGVTSGTGTTYDGATPRLRAVTPLESSSVTLVFSIQDLGDSIYDSAVFLDDFDWLFSIDCAEGLFADSDGDALLDDWEINGIDVDGDGSIDIDLPAMGADPNHKDAFIEIDYMVLSGTGGHSHKPKAAALTAIIDAFANSPLGNPDGTTGVTLHIDAGADTVMNPVTGALWAAMSQSGVLTHDNNLGAVSGSSYDWTEFDGIKGTGATPGEFSIFRRDVFHYAIFAHNLATSQGGTSGISRGISASDFIVSLGSWTDSVGTVNQQAGTLMHEFGHNLDLRHGGDDNDNFKPNYLSVMNYAFQTRGLRNGGADGNFDYSFIDLPDLVENNLDETVGLNGGVSVDTYGTRYYCVKTLSAAAAAGDTTVTISDASVFPTNPFPSLVARIDDTESITWTGKTGNQLTGVVGCTSAGCAAAGLVLAHASGETVTHQRLVNMANNPIDWDCDGDSTDMSAAGDINKSGANTTLTSYDDWSNARFGITIIRCGPVST